MGMVLKEVNELSPSYTIPHIQNKLFDYNTIQYTIQFYNLFEFIQMPSL